MYCNDLVKSDTVGYSFQKPKCLKDEKNEESGFWNI